MSRIALLTGAQSSVKAGWKKCKSSRVSVSSRLVFGRAKAHCLRTSPTPLRRSTTNGDAHAPTQIGGRRPVLYRSRTDLRAGRKKPRRTHRANQPGGWGRETDGHHWGAGGSCWLKLRPQQVPIVGTQILARNLSACRRLNGRAVFRRDMPLTTHPLVHGLRADRKHPGQCGLAP